MGTYSFYYTELYYLIYWRENEVSVHGDVEIKEPVAMERVVGGSCMVCYRRKLYEGTIACIGN